MLSKDFKGIQAKRSKFTLFQLRRHYSSSLNLDIVAELYTYKVGTKLVETTIKLRKGRKNSPSSANEFGYFTLVLCRRRQRNARNFITLVQGTSTYFFCGVFIAEETAGEKELDKNKLPLRRQLIPRLSQLFLKMLVVARQM